MTTHFQLAAIRSRRRAFTLMETALTTIIVGLAITALVKLVLMNTQQNRWSQRVQVGTLLAENVREMMAGLPFADPAYGTSNPVGPDGGEALATFNDVDDFDGFNSTNRPDLPVGAPVGPVDAARRVITQTVGGVAQVPPEWKNWRQQITVEPILYGGSKNLPNDLNVTTLKTDTNRNCVRITVTITYQPPGSSAWEQVVQLRWIKTR